MSSFRVRDTVIKFKRFEENGKEVEIVINADDFFISKIYCNRERPSKECDFQLKYYIFIVGSISKSEISETTYNLLENKLKDLFHFHDLTKDG